MPKLPNVLHSYCCKIMSALSCIPISIENMGKSAAEGQFKCRAWLRGNENEFRETLEKDRAFK